MTATVFEILLALSDGERHGYDIMREVEQRSVGATIMRPGSLYRALHRLLEQGLVEELEERPDPELDDERRRYYRITDIGAEAIASEVERMDGAVRAARAEHQQQALQEAQQLVQQLRSELEAAQAPAAKRIAMAGAGGQDSKDGDVGLLRRQVQQMQRELEQALETNARLEARLGQGNYNSSTRCTTTRC